MMRDAASRAELLWYLRFYHVGMIWSAGLVQTTLKVRAYVQRAAGRQIKESPPASTLRVAAATSPVRARRVPALLGFPTQGRAACFPLAAETPCRLWLMPNHPYPCCHCHSLTLASKKGRVCPLPDRLKAACKERLACEAYKDYRPTAESYSGRSTSGQHHDAVAAQEQKARSTGETVASGLDQSSWRQSGHSMHNLGHLHRRSQACGLASARSARTFYVRILNERSSAL